MRKKEIIKKLEMLTAKVDELEAKVKHLEKQNEEYMQVARDVRIIYSNAKKVDLKTTDNILDTWLGEVL